jgi:ArsR family transcriptional regulator
MGDHTQNALVYKAFCDENRLLIIDQLSLGERCACDLLEKVSISQSTLSHHMGILLESGIVSARKVGKWTYYSLNPLGCLSAVDELRKIVSPKESIASSCVCE